MHGFLVFFKDNSDKELSRFVTLRSPYLSHFFALCDFNSEKLLQFVGVERSVHRFNESDPHAHELVVENLRRLDEPHAHFLVLLFQNLLDSTNLCLIKLDHVN